MLEYYIGRISFVRLTRQNFFFGLALENPFDPELVKDRRKGMLVDNIYAWQELQSQRPHMLALQEQLIDHSNWCLDHYRKRPNNGMKKVGRRPSYIHCKASLCTLLTKDGPTTLDFLSNVDRNEWVIIRSEYISNYQFRIHRMRIFKEKEDLLEAITNAQITSHLFLQEDKNTLAFYKANSERDRVVYDDLLNTCLLMENDEDITMVDTDSTKGEAGSPPYTVDLDGVIVID